MTGKQYNYRYSERLVKAVEYFIKDKNIKRSGEIARRLEVSPFTVRNIKQMLRAREGSKKKKRSKKKKKTIIDILTGE